MFCFEGKWWTQNMSQIKMAIFNILLMNLTWWMGFWMKTIIFQTFGNSVYAFVTPYLAYKCVIFCDRPNWQIMHRAQKIQTIFSFEVTIEWVMILPILQKRNIWQKIDNIKKTYFSLKTTSLLHSPLVTLIQYASLWNRVG